MSYYGVPAGDYYGGAKKGDYYRGDAPKRRKAAKKKASRSGSPRRKEHPFARRMRLARARRR